MIVVIDCGLGNVGSIVNMLKKIGVDVYRSSDKSIIEMADKLILPGVGAFDEGMKQLKDSGLRNLLDKKVIEEKTPVLGICLGMQLMTQKSEEGELPGLGWIKGMTIKFNFENSISKCRIPHMGWNRVVPKEGEQLFQNLIAPKYYFVHSYHVVCENPEEIIATSNYGKEFTCAIRNGNVLGTQFHPEKSHKYGMVLLNNFTRINAGA